jgi:hypothetical protein
MIVEALPPELTLVLTELSLLLLGFLAEKYYVSRLTSFANAIAITIHILSQENVGFWLGIYGDIAVLIGVIGLVAYAAESSLHAYYYDISFFLYSSVNVGLVIALSGNFIIALVLGILIQLGLGMVYGDEKLVHRGEFAGSVKRFHLENNLEIVDGTGRHSYDFSEWFK